MKTYRAQLDKSNQQNQEFHLNNSMHQHKPSGLPAEWTVDDCRTPASDS